jgi:hypothetical protein
MGNHHLYSDIHTVSHGLEGFSSWPAELAFELVAHVDDGVKADPPSPK